ncbi:MAG TPA: PP2C family protein-serine/threonine phosphatase [Candidatus Limnocylindrales bacterium]|nr:PP2C family protein-serine/threonine phosphatase [Candidatus Limnocylindrales bacterium]
MSDPRDREIAELRATLAFERRRLERELDFARRIQLNLMPATPPQPAGWEIATAYRAARVVGGDFYDAFELPGPGGRIGLIIADVTGKGLTAALMMAFTRAVHRAAAYKGNSPADWLERTNRVLVRDARTGLFVTAIAAEVDPSKGMLRYASAGHEPALLARGSSHSVEELPAGGMLLGLAEPAPTADREVVFESGDLVMLYTDGITDAVDPDGTRFGADRLAKAVARAWGRTAPEAVAEVLGAVDRFVGSAEPADDLTLVAVRRLP